MTFEPKFSQAVERMAQAGDDAWQVHLDAQARLAQGDDIILMSVGDHDLPTIETIIEHAVTRLYRGRTHYSPGMGEPELRQVIADIETQASGKATTQDQVIIFPGATNAIYSVLSCLLNEGDELILAEPSYVGYDGIMNAIGASVRRIAGDPALGFAVDTDELIAAITPRTRVMLLNTPGNPSGHIMPGKQLQRLAAHCLEAGVWLVCDEVYSMITFEERHVSARKAAQHLDNVVVIDGLSKSHAMTGWRLGWAVAPNSLIPPLLKFTSATVFGCSQFIQDAAAFALQNDAEYIASIVSAYRQRRDFACARITAIDGLRCSAPQAGMFLMIEVSAVAADGETFARALLAEEGVSVLPGAGFGAVAASFVRLSLTHPEEVLAEAFDRIERFIASGRS